MEVEQVLRMNGGSGDTSYANNSLLQGKVISRAKAIIEDTSEVFCSINMASNSNSNIFSMAELGCSCGPTTLLAAAEVVKTVHRLSLKHRRELPEFQILLNDLPGNDFNSISQWLIPRFQAQVREEMGVTQCFVYGVPGSFYGRLFPSNTLHLVHSSYSVMWLSKVPKGLEMNKGCIFIGSESPLSVINAYYDQFRRDFGTFLKCRAEEVVVGGKMVLTILVRKTASKEYCYTWELLGVALKLMVSEGVVEEEKLDSFNIPQYTPSAREIKEEVAKEGSFSITQFESSEISWAACAINDNEKNANYVTKCIRSIAEPLLVKHFGGSIIDQLFVKYQKIISDCILRSREKTKLYNVTVSLTRI